MSSELSISMGKKDKTKPQIKNHDFTTAKIANVMWRWDIAPASLIINICHIYEFHNFFGEETHGNPGSCLIIKSIN